MNQQRLLNSSQLEDSPVVANCCMNRERDFRGSNGYEVELGLDPLEWLQDRLAKQTIVRWLDLCCGSGKALIQAASSSDEHQSRSIKLPFKYLGADDTAGPNYTKQPVVNSYYE